MTGRPARTCRVLLINASERTVSVVEPCEDTVSWFIGGRGLAGFFMRPYAQAEPCSPESPLIFMTGPLAGTSAPSSDRFCIMTRSPLTGTVSPSMAGGTFGREMKRAGWDGIILTGKSDSPLGIVIRNSDVKFEDCYDMKGITISGRSSRFSGGAWAVTGPAAENGVLFSTMALSGNPYAPRGGHGLVMASKNIGYIHVCGSGTVRVHDLEKLAKAREDILRLVSASPYLSGEQGISRCGTMALYDLVCSRGMMPTNNFRETVFASAALMNAHSCMNRYDTHGTGCSGCGILCGRIDPGGDILPGYDAMAHLSALTGNSSPGNVMESFRVCRETGMDPVSAASTIACCMETRGIEPGRADIVKMLLDTASSRGDGELLRSGSHRYAYAAGRPELSMSVKKLELPAFDPRGAYGTALSYVTSTRGGCYMNAWAISHEILRKPVATNRFTFSGKARIIKSSEDMYAAADSLGACDHVFFTASLEEYARAFTAVTGIETDSHELMVSGGRIYYNEICMNSLNGFDSKDDDLPPRFFTENGSSINGIDIPPIDRNAFLEERAKYYRIRGLTADGVPVKEKCVELGLEWKDLN